MQETKKNTSSGRKRFTAKRKLPAVTVVTKTAVPVKEIPFPEKFDKMNEMLTKTTFLPFCIK